MAIVKELKCFFIHIPRTGGHTIDAVLGHRRNKKLDKVKRHAQPINYINFFPEEWESFYKFTFIRNPWDRFVSAWTRSRGESNYRIKDVKNIDDNKWFYRNLYIPFNEYVQNNLSNSVKTGHFIPQSTWLFDDKGRMYPYNYIGRYENFKNCLQKIIDDLQIDFDINNLPRISPSNKRNYIDYYDDRSVEIIRKEYKKEIEYFNYEFGE